MKLYWAGFTIVLWLILWRVGWKKLVAWLDSWKEMDEKVWRRVVNNQPLKRKKND